MHLLVNVDRPAVPIRVPGWPRQQPHERTHDHGVDGLVHIGELSWVEHPHHPSELLTIGQEVEAVVVNIDLAKHRVGMALKQELRRLREVLT